MKMTIEGVDKLNTALKMIPDKTAKAIEKELKTVALDLQGKAQMLAPVMTGDLRGSAFAVVGKVMAAEPLADSDPKSIRGDIPKAENLEAIVGFSEPYALRQHEETGYRHPKGGQAKYLETPYKQNRDRYVKYIQEEIRKAVEK